MQNNPDAIKLLAQAINTSPEWVGPSGVFFNRFSGYVGVKIFAEYVKHLKQSNGNRVPDVLPRKARDFVDYLNELPEDKKEEYSSYFQNVVPKMYNMIRDAKMTKESILEFAHIFNELGIGQNPMTIVADYQTAISDALQFKTVSANGESEEKKQKETYKQLAFSEKEKAEIVEKCRQKGVTVSSDELDSYYVSSSGGIYLGDGTATTNAAVVAAVSQTLQYQMGIGNAAKLSLTAVEIEAILAMCEQRGIKITKQELENICIDKDGQLFFGDGTAITDTDLGTAITQTETYGNAYQQFADKRGEKVVAPEVRDQEEPELVLPEEIGDVMPTIRPLINPEHVNDQAADLAAGKTGSSPNLARAQGGIDFLPPNKDLFSISPGIKDGSLLGGKKLLPMPIRRMRNGLRRRAKGPAKISDQGDQGQDQQAQTRRQQEEQAMAQRGGTEQRGMDDTPAALAPGGNKFVERCTKVCLFGGACWGGEKIVFGATFFMPLAHLDHHYFISTILTILFQ